MAGQSPSVEDRDATRAALTLRKQLLTMNEDASRMLPLLSTEPHCNPRESELCTGAVSYPDVRITSARRRSSVQICACVCVWIKLPHDSGKNGGLTRHEIIMMGAVELVCLRSGGSALDARNKAFAI